MGTGAHIYIYMYIYIYIPTFILGGLVGSPGNLNTTN